MSEAGPRAGGQRGALLCGQCQGFGAGQIVGMGDPCPGAPAPSGSPWAKGLGSDVRFGGRASDVNIVDDGDNLLFCDN